MTHWQHKKCFRLDRTCKRGGGVLCYLSEKLAAYSNVVSELTVANLDIECLTVNFRKPNNKLMMLCTVYRPPKGNMNVFLEHLDKLAENVEGEIFIMGDLNIDVRKVDTPKCKRLLAHCRLNGWSLLIDKITRLNKKGGTAIDNIITNSAHIMENGVINRLISDHLPIFCVRKKLPEKYVIKEVTGRSYRKYDKDELQNCIREQDWDAFYMLPTVEQKWNFIVDAIMAYLDEECPMRTFTFKDHQKEWMDNEVLEAMRDRDDLVIEHKRFPTDPVCRN